MEGEPGKEAEGGGKMEAEKTSGELNVGVEGDEPGAEVNGNGKAELGEEEEREEKEDAAVVAGDFEKEKSEEVLLESKDNQDCSTDPTGQWPSGEEASDEPIVMEVDIEEEEAMEEPGERSVEEVESVELVEGAGPPTDQPEGIVEDMDSVQGTDPPRTEEEGVEFTEIEETKDPSPDTETSEAGNGSVQTSSSSEQEPPGDDDVPDLERIQEESISTTSKTMESSETIESDDPAIIHETESEEVEAELVELRNKKDVFLFDIPMEDKSKSRKASEWNLKEPIWSGSIQLLSQGTKCVLKLEDENQALYGYAVIESYPSDDLNTVTDSSRYFVLKFTKDNSEANEPDTEEIVGMGFSDREESADFKWALDEHFEKVEKQSRGAGVNTMEVQEPSAGEKSTAEQPQVSKKRKSSGGTSEPAKKVMFADEVPTSSSHIVIEGGDVEKYVKQGLKRPGIFPCRLCTATFDDMRHIKTHWRQVHELRHPTHCVDCHRPFPTAEEMVEHRNEAHGHKCPKCSRNFRLDRLLEAHFLSEHMEQLEYRCSVCKEKFEARADLKSHLEAAHPSSLVRCPECPAEKLFTEAELAAHAGAHDKYLFCHLCDCSFTTKGQLRNHVESAHPGAEPLKLL